MGLEITLELDAAVAKACGFDARIFDFAAEGPRCVRKNDRGGEEVFEPSIDLNDAFVAAEKAGLFSSPHRRLEKDSEWEVYEQTSYDDGVTLGSGATPAEAICRAILALCKAG